VEAGLVLFDKRPGGHTFCLLVCYETGCNLFTLRQAVRRSWRIGWKRECRVYCLFYEATMQEAAMALKGRKLSAAQALDEHLPGDTPRAWEAIAETADGAVEDVESEPLEVAAVEPSVWRAMPTSRGRSRRRR
jgi:hypothetical protein